MDSSPPALVPTRCRIGGREGAVLARDPSLTSQRIPGLVRMLAKGR